MKKITFLLITSALVSSVFAYPIAPCPLRKLVIQSDLIVWAKVIKTGSTISSKENPDFRERDYALLVVNEILQGNLTQDTLKVFFTARMICPEPGVFYENETALAFLDKIKDGDGYWIHALSYGAKHGLSRQGYEAYRSRILEMKEILKLKDDTNRDEIIIDWLVKCAEQSSTRWEGVYELSYSNSLSFYGYDEWAKKTIYLNACQLTRLFDALMKVDTIKPADMGLANLVKGVNNSLLLSFLKSKISLINDEGLWLAGDVMRRITKLTENKELEAILKTFDETRFDFTDKSRKERKTIFSQFVLKMKDAALKENILPSVRSAT